ncbi:MAG TPA: hypothetical protein VF009_06935 [Solirubrobacterales bacterium]
MIALTLVCLALIVALVIEKRLNSQREKEWALERAALLQRIQAPEREVARFAREQAGADKRERPRTLVSDDAAQLREIRQREGITDADPE